MVLSGWKEIAQYLSCGVRTAQRWEKKGLPVLRPAPGKRSHVVVDSVRLDAWLSRGIFLRTSRKDRLETIQRTRELRAEVQQARLDLHLKMTALRHEVAGLMGRKRR